MLKFKKNLLLLLCSLLLFNIIATANVYASANPIRLEGSDRYDTAVKISKDGWQESNYIVIASGTDFPDALSAAPLAKKYNAPILLVSGQTLNDNIIDEILRLGAGYAFIIGGKGAVSESIERDLNNLNIYTNRIAGADRYETSLKIAEFIGTSNGVTIVSGENFPDALSIAPIAGIKQMPILLTRSNTLSQNVQALLKNNYINKCYVIGGTGVISNSALNGIDNYTRLSGSNRYSTNLAVINEFADVLNFSTIYLATGENFPDALGGSVIAANSSSPLILASNQYYAAGDLIKNKLDNINEFKILGGTGALAASTADSISKGMPIASKIVLGYATNYSSTDTASYNSILNNSASINEIATVTFNADSFGNIDGNIPYRQIELATKNNIKPLALVSNSFDKDIAKSILENTQVRQNLINNILTQLKLNGYSGVNIDFENLYTYDRDYFTMFIKELYTALHAENFMVTVSVPAKTKEDLTNSWNGAFDYPQIANNSDQVVIMAYDEHYLYGNAGPVASIGWVQSVLNYALSTIPKNKILLGVASYGYDWSSSGNTAYSLNKINSLISKYNAKIQWDSNSKCPYFTYKDNAGVNHTVWFENNTSLIYKLKLINDSGIAGIAVWRLGFEDSGYWSTIADMFN